MLASVHALRFLTAAWVTTRPLAVLTGEVLARGQVRTYRIRATGVAVALQHGRDLEALFELFSRGVVVVAVAPADGETGFVEGWGAGSHVPTDAEQSTTVVRTVDWYPLFAAADLVKMDIEGGEWAVLTDPRLADRAAHPRHGVPPRRRSVAAGIRRGARAARGGRLPGRPRHPQLLGARHAVGLEGLTEPSRRSPAQRQPRQHLVPRALPTLPRQV